MPYIGKTPLTGAYQLCDTITTSATATYNLLVGGSAVIPGSANNCIVSLNGVVQAPVGAFTVSGSTITFASTLSSSDVIDFILILGNVFDIGTPTNGAVTNSSLNSNVITGQSAETSIAGGDLVLLYDDSASALRKMTRTNFVAGLTGGTQEFAAGTVSLPSITTTGDTNTGVFFPAADTIAFTEGGTEAMRIDSSGQVGIGTTPSSTVLSVKKNTASAISQLHQENSSTFAAAVVDILCARNTTNSSYFFLNCVITGVQVKLQIADSGNVVNINNSYGAISDQKLKENIIDASSQWEDIKNIPVRKFSFKTDNLQTPNKIGVIAQELEALGMSGLVEETYDDIRDTNKFLEDGETPNPNYWNVIGKSETEKTKQVKYSVLYMKSVKALQEAMERIEQLEARLTALDSK